MRSLKKWAGKLGHVMVMAAMFILLTAGSALAAWTNDEPLTYGGSPLKGNGENVRIGWNPVSQRIGMAYVEVGSQTLIYVEWKRNSGVVEKEVVSGPGKTFFTLGLAYDKKGLPRVGAAGASNICEYVKQAGGTWACNDTGINPRYDGRYGSYAYNPAADVGAFLVNSRPDTGANTLPQATYIYYQDGKWHALNCGTGGAIATSIAFTPAAAPFVLWGKKTPPTKEEGVAMGRIAGAATPGATNFQPVTSPLLYEQLGDGKVVVDPTTGEVWVAYVAEDWHLYGRKWTGAGWTAPAVIDDGTQMNGSNSAQLGFVILPSHDKVLMYPTAAGGAGGINMAYWDHITSHWTTEVLSARGSVLGLDLAYDNERSLYGLYLASDAKFHMLSGYTPPARLYIKVTMNNQAEPCVINAFGHRPNGSFTPLCYISGDGMCVEGTKYPGNGPRLLKGNEQSPWMDLAPLALAPSGDNIVQFSATKDAAGSYIDYSMRQADFTIVVSPTPSDAGIIKTFARSGAGSGMTIDMNLGKLDQMKDDLAWSQWECDIVRALPATPGRRPAKFPILTGDGIDPACFRTATVNNETDVLAKLGFNGIDTSTHFFDPAWYNAGFTYFAVGTGYRAAPYLIDNDRSNPDAALIADFVKKDAQTFIKRSGHGADRFAYYTLADEPGILPLSPSSSPVCKAKFRTYLKDLGYTPQFFGKTTWDQVNPETDKAAYPKQYYHAAMFRDQLLVDMFKVGTKPLKEIIPNVPTTANFSDEITSVGSMLFSGVDQFAMFEQEGLRLGWTETWMPWTSTHQLAGYLADFLRSAVNGHGTGKFGMYNCEGYSFHTWDNAAKKFAEIGHGAQAIYDYNWGPYYAFSVDQSSQHASYYPALQIPNYAIGAVEDYLVGATVPKSRVAILYSQATDIWGLDENYSLFGQENLGIWLILRHLGYPVDFVQEKDVAAGKLTKENYKMVICNASHLLDTALPPLVSWLKAGGVLYMGPGALTYDQYNTPLGFDSQAGISRQAFERKDTQSVIATELPKFKDLMSVTCGSNTLEALCGYQKMNAAPADAKVLATYADGTAALFTKPAGSGLLEFSGFFPGLGYEKAGVIVMQAHEQATGGHHADADIEDVNAMHEREKAIPDLPTVQGATDWPAAHRALFTALLKPVMYTLPVTTSHYLVEADRLEASATQPGSLVVLSNWTGKPLSGLTIALPRNGMQGVATTVVNPIISQSTSNGVLTVTMDMKGPVDFIVVPR